MAIRTIKAKNYLDINEEFLANGAITPGMLVAQTDEHDVTAHATAGGNAVPMFACEDELQGKGIDDVFADNDTIPAVWIPQRGDQVYAILADGENAAIGDFLESHGDGMLQVYAVDTVSSAEAAVIYPLQIVGVALEAVDISDSSGGESSGTLGYDKRILIRIV